MPETSIVIRTFNEEKHLGDLLGAIKKQNYKNYEVIIVDSGSTDKTLEIAEKFQAKIVKIENRDFTFGYALNVGCKAGRGKYLVFASAHVLPVDHKWLTSLLKPLEDDKVAMVYGRQLGHQTSKFSEQRDFRRLFGSSPRNDKVPFGYANNANAAIQRNLWERKNFDDYLFGLEDIAWAKSYADKGYVIHYEPKAAIYHIHNEKWFQVFNRYRREAIAAFRIGLEQPPQVGLGFGRLVKNLISDMLSAFPVWSWSRLEEILFFRYYQWKGSRQGWFRDRGLDLDRDKQNLFFPISAKNEAVVIDAKGQARIKEIDLPEMKPGDIMIQVSYVGVCRTDLEVYEGSLGYYRDGLANYPIVPGHEFSGTIIRIGANNKYRERFKIGERVVGECILSRGGISERKEIGVINHNGAYCKYVVVPGSTVHQISADLDLRVATLAEPLAVVLRAIRRVRNRLQTESKIGIIGAGPIGNLCAQVLSLENHRVTVFDKNPARLKLLEGKVSRTSTQTEDLGRFDLIIEATGSAEVLSLVLQRSAIDSTLLLLGFPYANIDYNFEELVSLEKMVIGSVGAESQDFPRALALLPKLDLVSFVSTVLPLREFEKAWKMQKTGECLKLILEL